MNYYSLIGPLARMLPAETAHEMAVRALASGLWPGMEPVRSPALAQDVFGLSFPNPVGLAAGFDKNAEAIDGLLGQGFGFVEAGTVTPISQPGNPRPRLFRLAEDEAIINRLGFNNQGVHSFAHNLQRRRKTGIVGANLGKNKDSLDFVHDYVTCLRAVYAHADYITINISSPNTVGLRDLQQKNALGELMRTMGTTRREMEASHGRKPILYKIAPDLTMQDKEDIAGTALECAVDGLIVTNTTIERPASLKNTAKTERGGLSGKPLTALSLVTLRDIYRLTDGKLPLIGVGGISSADDAYARILAGASLIQLYTALVYQGFGLVRRINDGLAAMLARDGFATVRDAVGKE